MGLFNWLSWQLERRIIIKEMDRLRDELAESKEQLLYAKRDIAELRSENEILSQPTTEPAETELERKAWEVFMRYQGYNLAQAFELAHGFMEERDRRRKEQENKNNGPF